MMILSNINNKNPQEQKIKDENQTLNIVNYNAYSNIDYNNALELLEKFSLRVIEYYDENLNITFENNFKIIKVNEIIIDEVAVSISLSNDMNGSVYMGVSHDHAMDMIDKFIDDSMLEEEVNSLSKGNISEILNIALGNILKELNVMKDGGLVEISTPTILNKNFDITKDKTSVIFMTTLKYKNDQITLGYFV